MDQLSTGPQPRAVDRHILFSSRAVFLFPAGAVAVPRALPPWSRPHMPSPAHRPATAASPESRSRLPEVIRSTDGHQWPSEALPLADAHRPPKPPPVHLPSSVIVGEPPSLPEIHRRCRSRCKAAQTTAINGRSQAHTASLPLCHPPFPSSSSCAASSEPPPLAGGCWMKPSAPAPCSPPRSARPPSQFAAFRPTTPPSLLLSIAGWPPLQAPGRLSMPHRPWLHRRLRPNKCPCIRPCAIATTSSVRSPHNCHGSCCNHRWPPAHTPPQPCTARHHRLHARAAFGAVLCSSLPWPLPSLVVPNISPSHPIIRQRLQLQHGAAR